MPFALTADQRELRSTVEGLLSDVCTTEDVRHAGEEGNGGEDGRERWRHLKDMGVVGLLAPVEHGGLAMGMADLALVLEETGRAALPEPVVETAAVAVPLLRDVADEAAASWLTAVLEGAIVTATATGLFPCPDTADALLILRDDRIVLASIQDVTLQRQSTIDRSRPVARLLHEEVGGDVLARGDEASRHIRAARHRGAIGTAAQLLGLARRSIELAVAHAKDREQFGRPIGSFQAVKHLLADALLSLEFATPLVRAAAWAIDEGEDSAGRDAAIAKVRAAEAATRASRTALQVHGAIGYTWEHDLHLFLKRTESLRGAWGTVEEHLASLETDVLNDGGRFS